MKFKLDKDKLTDIVILCGYACTGKSTQCRRLVAECPEYQLIVVSDIVKELSGRKDQSRTDLALEEISIDSIGSALIERITQHLQRGNRVVVDGIRRPEYLLRVMTIFPLGLISLIWLETDLLTGKERFTTRQRAGDTGLTYESTIDVDNALGMDQIKQFVENMQRINT